MLVGENEVEPKPQPRPQPIPGLILVPVPVPIPDPIPSLSPSLSLSLSHPFPCPIPIPALVPVPISPPSPGHVADGESPGLIQTPGQSPGAAQRAHSRAGCDGSRAMSHLPRAGVGRLAPPLADGNFFYLQKFLCAWTGKTPAAPGWDPPSASFYKKTSSSREGQSHLCSVPAPIAAGTEEVSPSPRCRRLYNPPPGMSALGISRKGKIK